MTTNDVSVNPAWGVCVLNYFPFQLLIGLDPATSVADINKSQRWQWWL